MDIAIKFQNSSETKLTLILLGNSPMFLFYTLPKQLLFQKYNINIVNIPFTKDCTEDNKEYMKLTITNKLNLIGESDVIVIDYCSTGKSISGFIEYIKNETIINQISTFRTLCIVHVEEEGTLLQNINPDYTIKAGLSDIQSNKVMFRDRLVPRISYSFKNTIDNDIDFDFTNTWTKIQNNLTEILSGSESNGFSSSENHTNDPELIFEYILYEKEKKEKKEKDKIYFVHNENNDKKYDPLNTLSYIKIFSTLFENPIKQQLIALNGGNKSSLFITSILGMVFTFTIAFIPR